MVSLRKLIPFRIRLQVEIEVFKTLAKGSRIVEYPFIIGNANIAEPSKTLVFGCFNDFAAIQLASIGFEVFGFDLQDNVFRHPNFKFIKGDFLLTSKRFPDGFFDLAFALSSIEHAVIDTHSRQIIEKGDEKTVAEIHRLLKSGGRFLLTVPFGQAGLYPRKKPTYKKYDRGSLRQLLKDFDVYYSRYFGCATDGIWLPSAPETLENEHPSDIPRSVACICARK